ncbi:helix-turn-helix domain-containing protein [Pseudarthrobacter sp. YS3]|uniref:helix-turn-helix domain-containing protein n=1 Tax=Pseudarthrobacter sp. YS3 TaxID=3453718 RepID=UPI003EEA9DCD
MPNLLNIQEVSEMTRIPVATLRYWRHRGEGPRAARFGARILYKQEDVTAWIEAAFESGAA